MLKHDVEQAQEWCTELLKGNTAVVDEVRQRYEDRLHFFIERMLSGLKTVHVNKDNQGNIRINRGGDLLQEFWQVLHDGKIICNYKGLNKASLGSYLQGVLRFKGCDFLRKHNREIPTAVTGNETGNTDVGFPGSAPLLPPEIILSKDEQQKILRNLTSEALLLLSERDPESAWILRRHSRGDTFRKLAETNGFSPDEDEKLFKREHDRLRKKSERAEVKFKKLFNGLLLQHGLVMRLSGTNHPVFMDASQDKKEKELCISAISKALARLVRKKKALYQKVREVIAGKCCLEVLALLEILPEKKEGHAQALKALKELFYSILSEQGVEVKIERGVVSFQKIVDTA